MTASVVCGKRLIEGVKNTFLDRKYGFPIKKGSKEGLGFLLLLLLLFFC